MQTTPALETAAGGAPGVASAKGRRVVDAPMRMFHWLFAFGFVGAYLSADGERWRALHVSLGYALAGLLALRVLYGLVGPRQARLGPMFRRLTAAPAWLRSFPRRLTRFSPAAVNWRQGQSLLMALLPVALLVLVVPLVLSGYASYDDWGGELGGELLEELHEFLGESLMAIALGHVALIAALSVLRRRNHALPMLTGRIEGSGPDIVRSNRAWLAALLLVATLGFVAWDWGQAPGALPPGTERGAAMSADRAGRQIREPSGATASARRSRLHPDQFVRQLLRRFAPEAHA